MQYLKKTYLRCTAKSDPSYPDDPMATDRPRTVPDDPRTVPDDPRTVSRRPRRPRAGSWGRDPGRGPFLSHGWLAHRPVA